jgi:hypothetical protein
MKAQVTLTVAESKRLIAKAVKKHPLVEEALKRGVVAIALGSTNAYIVEEVLGQRIERERYVAGLVDSVGACVVPRGERLETVYFEKGEAKRGDLNEIVTRMNHRDVFIKGANALDMYGTAGVMMASLTGGTIAKVLGVIKARGINLLIPVGLEKLIPESVDEVSMAAGIYGVEYSSGIPVGLMPVSGEVITEKEAFKILSGVEALSLGAGSLGEPGARTFLLLGEEGQVKKAVDVFKEVKGEKGVASLRGDCSRCHYSQCPRNKGGFE